MSLVGCRHEHRRNRKQEEMKVVFLNAVSDPNKLNRPICSCKRGEAKTVATLLFRNAFRNGQEGA
jgi:hypothetical protein